MGCTVLITRYVKGFTGNLTTQAYFSSTAHMLSILISTAHAFTVYFGNQRWPVLHSWQQLWCNVGSKHLSFVCAQGSDGLFVLCSGKRNTLIRTALIKSLFIYVMERSTQEHGVESICWLSTNLRPKHLQCSPRSSAATGKLNLWRGAVVM